jgi:3-hydroxybutyryl-CoA dehydrogenase
VEPAFPHPAGRSDRNRVDRARGRRQNHRSAHGDWQNGGARQEHVKRDVAGFVGNRLQHALWREAIALVEQGACDAQTIDTVIKASFGRRLAVLGPLENADLVGTDLTLAIHKIILGAIDSRPYPSPYLEKLVTDGCLGMKSGQGFRNWNADDISALQARVTRHLRDAQLRDAENPAT